MNATELYTVSPEFRGFIAAWEQDKMCPWALGDFLDEQGLPFHASVAREAAEVTGTLYDAMGVLPSKPGGLYPGKDSVSHTPWVWFNIREWREGSHTCDLPQVIIEQIIKDNGGGYNLSHHKTVVEALLVYLDASAKVKHAEFLNPCPVPDPRLV